MFNFSSINGGFRIEVADITLLFIFLFIFILILSIIVLKSKNNKLKSDLTKYQNVYESICNQKAELQIKLDLEKTQLDNLDSEYKKEINSLNSHITKLESENYIYLKELNNVKNDLLNFEKDKNNYLYDIVKKMFGDKTESFIKIIDSSTLSDSEKISFFNSFFADLIPIIKKGNKKL